MSPRLEFYVPFDNCVLVENPEVIPLFFHNRWFGQDRLKSDILLMVRHPTSTVGPANIIRSDYRTLLWARFEIGECEPSRKAVVGLAGKFRVGEDVFAVLRLDLNEPHHNCAITLSPVALDINGKAKLTYKNEQLATFLLVARIVLSSTKEWTWSYEEVVQTVRANGIPYHKFDDANAAFFLGELKKLGLVVDVGDLKYKRSVSIDMFEETFGVKLPRGY